MVMIMEYPVQWMSDRRNICTRRKRAPVPLCPPQIPHGLIRARTRANEGIRYGTTNTVVTCTELSAEYRPEIRRYSAPSEGNRNSCLNPRRRAAIVVCISAFPQVTINKFWNIFWQKQIFFRTPYFPSAIDFILVSTVASYDLQLLPGLKAALNCNLAFLNCLLK
jgi:hypothetical protein